MQGGGQFHPVRTSAGLDEIQQRAHDEMQAARQANRARRHRARHRGGHSSWLRLGRTKHPVAHAQSSASGTGTTGTTDARRGPGHSASHGY